MFSTGLSLRSKWAEALRCAYVHLPPSHSLACSASSRAEASADWLLASDKHSAALRRHKYIKSEFKSRFKGQGGRGERNRESERERDRGREACL